MKIGDIIINPYVSKEYDGKLNPMYATIYIGDNRSVDYKGRVHRWADKVYKEGNEREWKVVGHCNLYEWMYEQIIGAIEPPKEETL